MEPARIVAGTLFLVVGFPSAYGAVTAVVRGFSTLVWPRASGFLGSTRVETTLSARGSTLYRPGVSYTYIVNGRTYLGERIYFGNDAYWNSPGAAERMLSKIATSGPLTVYYRESEPSESVLLRGVRARTVLMLLMSLLFAALGVAILLGFGTVGRQH
jgi:hypothetical protein